MESQQLGRARKLHLQLSQWRVSELPRLATKAGFAICIPGNLGFVLFLLRQTRFALRNFGNCK
jgi:hypothetical protein